LRTVFDKAFSGHLECPNDREWNIGGKKSADNTGDVLGLPADGL
jgi:hypothetical protein